MTKCCQRTSGDFAAEGCHRRRFPVDYRNHEKTYVPATSGNEDSIHNLEADSQADPPANRTHGKMLEMSFLTNNMEWSARTIAELYRVRWGIETFFKELKQTCQIRDFIGYNENAVKWQVWTGLLVHMLLRYLRHVSRWRHSFSRLAGVVRACAWLRRNVVELLESFGANGTARVEKPAFSGLSGIAMKNGGVYRSSAYSRTLVATRIFEHYELTPMRSGMVVIPFCLLELACLDSLESHHQFVQQEIHDTYVQNPLFVKPPEADIVAHDDLPERIARERERLQLVRPFRFVWQCVGGLHVYPL